MRSAQLKNDKKIVRSDCLPTRLLVTSGFYTHKPVGTLDIRVFAAVTRGVGRVVRVTCKNEFQMNVRCIEIVDVFDNWKTERKWEQNGKKREHSSFFQKSFVGYRFYTDLLFMAFFVYDNFFEESDKSLAKK